MFLSSLKIKEFFSFLFFFSFPFLFFSILFYSFHFFSFHLISFFSFLFLSFLFYSIPFFSFLFISFHFISFLYFSFCKATDSKFSQQGKKKNLIKKMSCFFLDFTYGCHELTVTEWDRIEYDIRIGCDMM